MKTRAAVLWERGQPLSVEEVELDPPGPGEVLVEIKAAGVCHSDLHPAFDEWPMRPPLVLGHEGAGVVREVGPDVTRLTPGDPVVLCWAPACGRCAACGTTSARALGRERTSCAPPGADVGMGSRAPVTIRAGIRNCPKRGLRSGRWPSARIDSA